MCRNSLVFNTQHNNPYRLAAQRLHKEGSKVLRALFGVGLGLAIHLSLIHI